MITQQDTNALNEGQDAVSVTLDYGSREPKQTAIQVWQKKNIGYAK